MQSHVPAMWSVTILLVIGVSTVNSQQVINCPPQLFPSSNVGYVTATTLALLRTCCIIQQTGILPSDTVVTLVGLSRVLRNLDLSTVNLSNLPSYRNFTNSGLFAADVSLASDICALSANRLAALRIGDNVNCLLTANPLFCNGPLFLDGPYSAAYLVYRNGSLIAVSTLSQDISLRKPKDFNSISTTIDHHSAGMIAITTILPILFAVLLAIFSSLLFMSCCCCNKVFTPRKCQQES